MPIISRKTRRMAWSVGGGGFHSWATVWEAWWGIHHLCIYMYITKRGIMFHQETCLIWTQASPEPLQVTHRRQRRDSFIIPAFIPPGLSGIVICLLPLADWQLHGKKPKTKHQKRDRFRPRFVCTEASGGVLNNYDESILPNQSTLFTFTSVFFPPYRRILWCVGW